MHLHTWGRDESQATDTHGELRRIASRIVRTEGGHVEPGERVTGWGDRTGFGATGWSRKTCHISASGTILDQVSGVLWSKNG